MHSFKADLLNFFILLLALYPANSGLAADSIRIGVLAYGTLNWELQTIENHQLDEKHGFQIEQRLLSNPPAGKIALQSGAVDIIVSDWVWVSRQRSDGADYTLSPYSTASGSLVVPSDSKMRALEDLPGKRIGIAGGELDKNWLLLIALAKKTKNIDLDSSVEKVFGAPPLLNQQLLQGNLDAVLTYWHYAVRLEARGYREILNGAAILSGLGIETPLATLGYVFKDSWARNNRELVLNFLGATREAKNLLCESDTAWEATGALIQSANPETRRLLRLNYCEGRIKHWTSRDKAMAATVFSLLHEIAGPRLTGRSPDLADGTFWNE